jgi:ABC-type Fe2+-enterobactin transport system substrate-binding protein
MESGSPQTGGEVQADQASEETEKFVADVMASAPPPEAPVEADLTQETEQSSDVKPQASGQSSGPSGLGSEGEHQRADCLGPQG